ncbi:hypothetical protein Dimus_038158 [Dionaea muscipula]
MDAVELFFFFFHIELLNPCAFRMFSNFQLAESQSHLSFRASCLIEHSTAQHSSIIDGHGLVVEYPVTVRDGTLQRSWQVSFGHTDTGCNLSHAEGFRILS